MAKHKIEFEFENSDKNKVIDKVSKLLNTSPDSSMFDKRFDDKLIVNNLSEEQYYLLWREMEDSHLIVDMELFHKGGSLYQKGGIPHNYGGKTAEQVWDEWTEEQRGHFMNDHGLSDNYDDEEWQFIMSGDYKQMDKDIKEAVKQHISEGQYAKGGKVKDENEIIYRGIAIRRLFPSGYYEFYSDAKGRFLKFDDLESAKGEIDSRSYKKGGIIKTIYNFLNEKVSF